MILRAFNGMPAQWLPEVEWRGGDTGCALEVAGLPDGEVAVRSAHHPDGPALIFSAADLALFVAGARDGVFDDLCAERGRNEGPDEALRSA
ncbi:DUF397 domain-containing protein [Actinocorallia sp. A-T 12471]|uniref:DUF397 domain-containing protein n=1 Tax=Actinocorallia sp. A-T 12471 TaxID=3089813 RepID=UPI0029CFF963|nr:DUF397 domain-containing protein [Actinocorallia sp. A-T 12471]MDX6739258.1 DUF397 domain-containing protein [Actinocorallia sp. A-T 12471]